MEPAHKGRDAPAEGRTMSETATAALLAIVKSHGPLVRSELIRLASAAAQRSPSTCSSMLHKLITRGLLETEGQSRKNAVIREPTVARLTELLGGSQMPLVIPVGRVIQREGE